MAFPKLGSTITIRYEGQRITGKMTAIRPLDQTAYLDFGHGVGKWVPLRVIRAKYGD